MINIKFINKATLSLCLIVLSSCGTVGNYLNPFYEAPPPEAYLGERSDRAINGGADKTEKARSALEAMASYRRAQAPQPVDPVIQPAVVRLMWIPDRVNKNGDLVPPHYYYLKVLKDRWAVQDSFDLEDQLGSKTSTSNVPYVQQGDAN